jgi:hypothetical protein
MQCGCDADAKTPGYLRKDKRDMRLQMCLMQAPAEIIHPAVTLEYCNILQKSVTRSAMMIHLAAAVDNPKKVVLDGPAW